MRKLATILLLPLALATTLPAQAATVPGAIPGSFGVSETGAATYSIPIAVPPGTAGMEPKLSFNYSSQGGNGIAGVGWSLGGLSAIIRCPQTIVHDGATRGVQLDANDRFCLDGQRLILTTGTTYGAIGAEYRTEIESFTKVVSYGGTAGDPQYFKVWTKAGQIIEFGNTDDSRAEAQGKTVAAAWAANKINDTVGNYIAFAYFEDNANGEHRVARIDYTGNAAANVNPYNAVEFQYEARPDVDIGYVKGSKSKASQRLVKVLTTSASTIVKDYSLIYETGATTGISRLVSVAECSGNGDCLSPTTFGWQEGETGLDMVGVNTGIPNANALYTHGLDVDGDGITDVVYPNGTTWKVRFGGSVGFGPEVDTGIANAGYQYARPLDYNADGKGDLLVPYASSKWHLIRATGDRNEPFSAPFDTGVTDSAKTLNPQLADMNGDGLPDLVHAHDSYFYVASGNGVGLGVDSNTGVPIQQARTVNGTTYYWYYKPEYARIGDVDGDGLGDLMSPYLRLCYSFYYGFYNCNAYWHYVTKTRPGTSGNDLISTSQGYSQFTDYIYDYLASTSNGIPQTHLNQQTGDINGDGLSDIMTVAGNSSGQPVWWLCQGTGSAPLCSNTNFTASGSQAIRAMDYNADGFVDYLVGSYANGRFYVFQSNRTGFDLIDSGIPDAGYDQNPIVGDFNGDGLMDLMLSHNGVWSLHLHSGMQPDRLLTITDGLGAARSITYKPLTDPSVYTKGTGSTYPVQDVQAAMYVVSETAADDGIGGSFRNAYRYAGARSHLTGRGFLGFATLEQTDLQTGIVTRTDYSQSFPTIGIPTLSTKTSAGGVELARVVNTPASKPLNAGKTYFPYVAYSKEQGKDLNGAILPSTETWNTFDDWGNLTRTISQTSDGFKKQTDNTYANDPAKWFLGRLTRASVASTVNVVTQTRVSAFEYDSVTGFLNKEIIEPDTANVQFRLDTAYTFDAFGNRNTTTVSSPATGTAAVATRSTTTTYDASGQFPITTSNALGHTETKIFDPGLGAIKTLTGPNALTTAWQYDSFGRKTRETRADGTFTQWTYDFCDAACPAFGVYRIVTQTYGGSIQSAPVSVVYFDRLNREVRTATQGFDGTWIYKDTVYDAHGRIQKVSRPYFAGQPAYWATSEYDDLGRVVKVFEPDVPATPALSVVYNGLTISRTNRKNQTTTEARNSLGQKLSVTDALGNVTGYSYDPFGNLTHTTDPAGNQIVNLYDIQGRKTQTADPDLGLWKYEYNALGELAKQTDAKLQATTFKYDLLGRMTQRIEPGLTSDWIFDTAGYGKGKLHQAKTSAGYIRTYYYDNKGRHQLTLSNFGAGNPLLFNTAAYDAAGHLSEQYYPTGLGVKHVYNAYGYPSEVRNVSTNALYWKQNTQDAEGHIVKETYGNGVVVSRSHNVLNGRLVTRQDVTSGNEWIQFHYYDHDTLGNVRGHWNSGVGEWNGLTYDKLNRLTQNDRSLAGVPTTETVAYDPLGNITSKTGVGSYAYGDPLHKHAVTSAGGNSYSYDANGNLTGGGGKSAAWTAWNMPASLTQSGQTTSWLYGPEHDRYKMVTPGRTTWHLNPGVHQGGHYERTQYASGTVEHRTTLYGGGRPIGEVLSFDGTAPEQTRYFHSDGQGSITAVTDSAGAVLTRYRYDPWGKQTLVSGSNTGIDQTRQGHTGHEMLDGGLTHMNGRLYDPVLARFVSADPIVQAPYDLQSLNRYSYVLNNPLCYTDPTGFSAWTKFRDKILKPVAAIAVAWVVGPAVFNAVLPSAVGAAGATGMGMTGSVWAGAAVAGAASGAVVGGVVGGIYNGPQGIAQGAKYGAIGGAIMGPVSAMYSGAYNGSLNGAARYGYSAERVAVQSLAGGVSSAAQGRSFIDGLKSSFIPSALTYMAVSMRASMWDQSQLDPRNSSGESGGFMRDGHKGGGSRFNPANPEAISPLGGIQGREGFLGITWNSQPLIGWNYAPNSWQDRLIEAYAGPHDWLNSGYWYNNVGNAINHQGIASAFGEVLNGLNVIPASAFAGASVVQPYNYSAVFGR
jgi:RHS repeat-associated protein